MKTGKKKGLVSRTRYESDLLLELMPQESDSVQVKLRRLRQEARVALKAADLISDKIIHKKWINYKAFDMLHKKYSLSVECLKQIAVNLEQFNLINETIGKLKDAKLNDSPSGSIGIRRTATLRPTHSDESPNRKLSGSLF